MKKSADWGQCPFWEPSKRGLSLGCVVGGTCLDEMSLRGDGRKISDLEVLMTRQTLLLSFSMDQVLLECEHRVVDST